MRVDVLEWTLNDDDDDDDTGFLSNIVQDSYARTFVSLRS